MTTYYAPRTTFEGLLYVGTVNSTAATELTGIIGDVTMPFNPEANEVTPRGSRIKMVQAGQADAGITFEHNWVPSDPALLIIMNAYAGGTPISVRGKDYSAGKGPDWDVIVTKFERKEPKGKQQTVDIELKPTIGYRDPNAAVYV